MLVALGWVALFPALARRDRMDARRDQAQAARSFFKNNSI
jgi:hypothetical protein